MNWNKQLSRKYTIALCVAMVLAFTGPLFAETCWEQYQTKLVDADRKIRGCIDGIPYRGMTDIPLWLAEERLCEIQFFSDAWQAEIEYGSCMTAGEVVRWFKGGL